MYLEDASFLLILTGGDSAILKVYFKDNSELLPIFSFSPLRIITKLLLKENIAQVFNLQIII